MKFDELDEKMRTYETAFDLCAVPGMFLVARIDGRSFTRLTKEIHKFETPFDVRVRDMMVATTEHLMSCGFRCVYGYTQSDEISLLFHPEIDTFDRKLRKYDSILAGEASAKFSLLLGSHAAFDCRISQLPNENLVRDYFRWRNEDAHRNALNGYCYWQLRKDGGSATQATKRLNKMSVADKNELLFQYGINFNDVPNWQKRGTGLYWESFSKAGFNPKTGQAVNAERRRVKIDYDLPMKDSYDEFLLQLLAQSSNK